MEATAAVAALSALAHETRLEAFRLLARVSPQGLPAGEIAEALDLPPSTLSFHLAQLQQAGLLQSEREGRSIRYAIRVAGMRALLGHLTKQCCQGRPELCR